MSEPHIIVRRDRGIYPKKECELEMQTFGNDARDRILQGSHVYTVLKCLLPNLGTMQYTRSPVRSC